MPSFPANVNSRGVSGAFFEDQDIPERKSRPAVAIEPHDLGAVDDALEGTKTQRSIELGQLTRVARRQLRALLGEKSNQPIHVGLSYHQSGGVALVPFLDPARRATHLR